MTHLGVVPAVLNWAASRVGEVTSSACTIWRADVPKSMDVKSVFAKGQPSN